MWGSYDTWKRQCVGPAVCGSSSVRERSVGELRCGEVAMWGSFDVWQLWCSGIAVRGSHGFLELQRQAVM